MKDFFAMGGYGLFVWSAYGLSAVVIIANVVLAFKRERDLQRQLAVTSRSTGLTG
jgi:heme exporter protein D